MIVAKRKPLTKDIAYEASFWCSGGFGILSEEIWNDQNGNVARYNFAFILPHVTRKDNGRILGYDNAHGYHERHFMGQISHVAEQDFEQIRKLFYQEFAELRRLYGS